MDRFKTEMNAECQTYEQLLDLFRNPPAEYGEIVTWFWECGALDKRRLSWQLEQLKEQGCRGTIYYPRYLSGEPYGTVPAYFSDEWWDFFRHSVAEHERLGLKAGFASWEGLGYWRQRLRDKSAARPELKGRRLVAHEALAEKAGELVVSVPEGQEILSAVAYRQIETDRLDGDSARRVPSDGARAAFNAPSAGWKIVVVAAEPHDLDYLSPAVADCWIDIFCKVHEERLGEFIPRTLQSYWPDEMPCLAGNILFSDALLERFKAERGYDPRPLLAGLFADIGEKTEKVRCDYYEQMCALLEESFYKRIRDWHAERDMLYGTIATWGRDDPLGQTWTYGDFWRMFRWFDVPGNEDPWAHPTGRRYFFDGKMSSSACHIYGRQAAGVCGYWASGWGMTQEQNIAWTNENFAYGLTLYNSSAGQPHNPLGGWYQWVPPTIHCRQPYWKHWHVFGQYVRRLSAVMRQGGHRADVALLYPLTAMHAGWLRGGCFTAEADDAAATMISLARTLYPRNLDFDFVNDDVLCRAEIVGDRLRIGSAEMRAVVLPPMHTIRLQTLRKINAFFEAGGTVLAFRRLPHISQENGRNDPELRALLKDLFGVESSDAYYHETNVDSHMRDSVHTLTNQAGGHAIFQPAHEDRLVSDGHIGPRIWRLLREALGEPDVAVPAEDVFHTHQKIDEVDVYFLFNTCDNRRDVEVMVRAVGEPEIWDPLTGEVRMAHRFRHEGNVTRVRVTIDPHQGLILVVRPGHERPAIIEDNLEEVLDVRPDGNGGLAVRVVNTTAGRKSARLQHAGREFLCGARMDAVPRTVEMDGLWDFALRPTLDNRWGDFRWPASDEVIGPEARVFRYAEEGAADGMDLGWHEPGFDDGHWPQFVHSVGAYWLSSPAWPGTAADEISLRLACSGRLEPAVADTWQRVCYSERFGSKGIGVWQSVEGVSDDFLFFPAIGGSSDQTRCIFTHVLSPVAGTWHLHLGASHGRVSQVWLNSEQVFSGAVEAGTGPLRLPVRLRRGDNVLVVELVHLAGGAVQASASLQPADAVDRLAEPRPRATLKWFDQPTGLVYDIAPGSGKRVGWYRFDAPPGIKGMRLGLDARSARAWVDGKPVSIRHGVVRLRTATRKVTQVALRIQQRPGRYAAAAVPEPVRFDCTATKVPACDWCTLAMESYSGGAVYAKRFSLTAKQLAGRVVLDLGRVVNTAELRVNGQTVGVGMCRPFRFDVTDFVRRGENRLEVEVYNTLANHYGVGELRSEMVYPGQMTSGLLGPVTLRFPQDCVLTARPTQSAAKIGISASGEAKDGLGRAIRLDGGE